jgi:hypothetical protein
MLFYGVTAGPYFKMGTERVAFLGPVASYSHQVQDFYCFDRPAWTFGLTDSDISQAVIERFSADNYEHVAMVTFRGILTSRYGIFASLRGK